MQITGLNKAISIVRSAFRRLEARESQEHMQSRLQLNFEVRCDLRGRLTSPKLHINLARGSMANINYKTVGFIRGELYCDQIKWHCTGTKRHILHTIENPFEKLENTF